MYSKFILIFLSVLIYGSTEIQGDDYVNVEYVEAENVNPDDGNIEYVNPETVNIENAGPEPVIIEYVSPPPPYVENASPGSVNLENAEVPTKSETVLCPRIRGQFAIKIYHNETQTCYKEYTRGPCSTYMLWHQINDSQYGRCECISDSAGCGTKLNRPIAMDVNDGQCYPLFTKGNCKDNEWFIGDKDGKGICKKNICGDLTLPNVNQTFVEYFFRYHKINEYSIPIDVDVSELNSPFGFLYNGTCYSTFTQGPCRDGAFVYFEGTEPEIKCYNPEKEDRECRTFALQNTADNPCPKGTKKIGDDCMPIGLVTFS